MPFSTRNVRYLRISAHTILLLYIYLDDRHVEWMSDYILQRVLEDLRPVIGPKLKEEQGPSTAKRAPISVSRGDTYQFAFFFRKNEPHAVLVKTRNFTPVSASRPVQPDSQQSELLVPSNANKRKRARAKRGDKATLTIAQRHTTEKASVEIEDLTNEVANDSEHEPRRHRRSRTAARYQVDSDDQMESSGGISSEKNKQCQGEDPEASDVSSESSYASSRGLNVDGEDVEEEKPKMAMKVTYQGFTIYDRCLCIVVEPWPSLTGGARAPSVVPTSTIHRFPSLAPREPSLTSLQRERTPLFLPEIDSRRSVTPAPLPSRILPPVPLFDDTSSEHELEEDNEEGGMLAFSQALSLVRDDRAGSADEDENEGNAFLGDADERRGGL
ncbi:hypothetical protein BU17DRAFT_36998 [Hysterangium stoloniferum]|nr:hypothetical protein BU17DRAFT_36998 [Hysterangium stoloniferum]